MKDQNSKIDSKDLLNDIDQTLSGISKTTDKFFQKKLIAWCIRWTITVVLYFILWNKFWWLKWTLLFTIPLGLFSLFQILKYRKKIGDKISDMHDLT